MRRLVLLAALTALAVLPSMAVADSVAVRVKLLARAAPSFAAPSAGRLPARTPLAVLARKPDAEGTPWLKLTFRKTTGWVPRDRTRDPPKPSCRSRATGGRSGGGLLCGKLLAPATDLWATQNPLSGAYPNARARRWGADSTLAAIEVVSLAYWREFRLAPRIVIGDLSLRRGGRFGAHASHQQGLDLDVFYPSSGLPGARRPRTPRGPGEINRRRAQWLVNRFADENAAVVYIGVQAGLRRTRRNIEYLGFGHETHFHVRFKR